MSLADQVHLRLPAPGAGHARVSTCWVASLTTSSSTSAVTARAVALRTTGSGTLPGRKPGRRSVLPRSASRGCGGVSMSAAGHHDREAALQPLGERFGDLHGREILLKDHRCRRQSPPGAVVRAEGLEPPRLAPPEPKSGVSANSTTPACRPGVRPIRLPRSAPEPDGFSAAPASPQAAIPDAAHVL